LYIKKTDQTTGKEGRKEGRKEGMKERKLNSNSIL
jgi:hypothetical protein